METGVALSNSSSLQPEAFFCKKLNFTETMKG